MIRAVKTLVLTLLLLTFSYTTIYALDAPPEASLPTQQFIQERIERRQLLKAQIEAHKEEMAAKKEQFQEKTEARIASREAALSEIRKTRARDHFGRLYTRFAAAINRINTLIVRIESRLSTIKEEDPSADTTHIESAIASAKALLLDAQMDLEAASDNFDEVLESDDPKATFQLIKDTVIGIKDKLVEVHRILVSVIGDIKGLRVGNTYQYRSPKPVPSPAIVQ